MPRKRLEFKPAKAAKLKKFSDAYRPQIQRLQTPADARFCGDAVNFWRSG